MDGAHVSETFQKHSPALPLYLTLVSETAKPYVTVPGRNQTLFCCVFQSHYRVRNAVVQYFHYGQGSYVQ